MRRRLYALRLASPAYEVTGYQGAGAASGRALFAVAPERNVLVPFLDFRSEPLREERAFFVKSVRPGMNLPGGRRRLRQPLPHRLPLGPLPRL